MASVVIQPAGARLTTDATPFFRLAGAEADQYQPADRKPVVALKLLLKWLEAHDKRELAERIDRPLIWLYPLLYAVGGAIAMRLFLL